MKDFIREFHDLPLEVNDNMSDEHSDKQRQARISLRYQSHNNELWRNDVIVDHVCLPIESTKQEGIVRRSNKRILGMHGQWQAHGTGFTRKTTNVQSAGGLYLGVINRPSENRYVLPKFFPREVCAEKYSLKEWTKVVHSSESSSEQSDDERQQKCHTSQQQNIKSEQEAEEQTSKDVNCPTIIADSRPNFKKYRREEDSDVRQSLFQNESSPSPIQPSIEGLFGERQLNSDDAELLDNILTQIGNKRIHYDPSVAPQAEERFSLQPSDVALANYQPVEESEDESPLEQQESYHSSSHSSTLTLYIQSEVEQVQLQPNQHSQSCQTQIELINCDEKDFHLSFFDEEPEVSIKPARINRAKEILDQPLFDILEANSKQEHSSKSEDGIPVKPTPKRRILSLPKSTDKQALSTFEGTDPFKDFDWSPLMYEHSQAKEQEQEQNSIYRRKKITKLPEESRQSAASKLVVKSSFKKERSIKSVTHKPVFMPVRFHRHNRRH